MKKVFGFVAGILALSLSFSSCSQLDTEGEFESDSSRAAYTQTLNNAADVCNFVYKGYNGGSNGPVTVTRGSMNGRTIYLVTMSGTEIIKNQSTGYYTDLLAGFNLNNAYKSNVCNIVCNNIPRGSNIVLAGHSLGGMVAQQVASDNRVKANFNVLNTVTFGSPLLAAGTREGDVKRLGDTSDVVPYASGSTINNTAWAIAGLNRENGGYGNNLLAAHTESYLRSDVWGKYDAVGQKWGSSRIYLDMGTFKFYRSPTSVKW